MMIRHIKCICFLIILVLLSNLCFLGSAVSNSQTVPLEIFETKRNIRAQFSSKQIGDTFIFGKYEQNNNLDDGKEPIEWIILYKDKTLVILISKYILDCLPFNNSSKNVTWENSSLREYMNSIMKEEMFTDVEKSCLATSYLINSENCYTGSYSGKPTADYIYIPGIDEMIEFFTNKEFDCDTRLNELTKPNTNRVGYATDFAKARGVRVADNSHKYPGAGNYFLRTSGLMGKRIWYGDTYAEYFQTFISEYGSLNPNGTGINSIDDGIRPMIQICY